MLLTCGKCEQIIVNVLKRLCLFSYGYIFALKKCCLNAVNVISFSGGGLEELGGALKLPLKNGTVVN